jgi:hypothetical protein
MSHHYTVHLEAREDASHEVIDALMEAVEKHSGVVAGGPGFRNLSVTIAVNSESPMEAVNVGAAAVRQAAEKAGLHLREFIQCDASLSEHALRRFPRK